MAWLRIADVSNPPVVENPYSYPLDPFQKCAVKAINDHENVLVTAKTGSGKTLIGEYQIKVSLAKGKRVFYTTPIKSLTNQKFHDLKEMGLNVGILTGDVKFAPQADVVVMTTEILCNLLFKKDTPNESLLDLSLANVDAVVFDEVHYINDPDRGKVWEQCILLLPPEINLVMLSATIAEAPKFASWIGDAKQKPIHLISTQYRVVPLVHMLTNHEVMYDSKDIFHPDVYKRWLESLEGAKKKHEKHVEKVADRRRAGYDDAPINKDFQQHSFIHRLNAHVEELEQKNLLPALVFVFNRKKCEQYARKISHDLLDSSDVASVKHILDFHLHRYPYIQTSPQYHQLRALLEKGIAFHHSGLLPILKEIVEILFGKGFVKLLFATETFAVGINMPTKTVIFTSYTKHDGNGYRMLRPDEYTQMAGRAGRRGKDTRGHVYYLPDREPSTLSEVQRMMTGGQQTVSSKMKFDYDFLIKTFYGHALDWKEVMKKTFWYAQHQEHIAQMEKEYEAVIAKRNGLPITTAMIPDLDERVIIEETIATTQNAKKKAAQRQLEQWKVNHDEKRWDIAFDLYKKWRSYEAEVQSLVREIEDARHIEETIQPAIEFLTKEGYLGGDLGKLAANIHEGHSLLMSAAFHFKMFHHLTREELVSALAMFIEADTPDDEPPSICDVVVESAHTTLSAHMNVLAKKDVLRLNCDYWNLGRTWIDAAYNWMRGGSVAEVCAEDGIYEGNFVRAMLKLANIVDEWIAMATIQQDFTQLERLRDVRQQIVRDAVVPDSLYLRI
jgi:superfamily II RNA helicase